MGQTTSSAVATVTGENYTSTIYTTYTTFTGFPSQTSETSAEPTATTPPGPYESCGINPRDGGLEILDYDQGVPLVRDGGRAIFAPDLDGEIGSLNLQQGSEPSPDSNDNDLVYTDSEGAWFLAIYDDNEIGFESESSNGPDFVPSGTGGRSYVTTIWNLDCDAGLNAILPNGTSYSFLYNAEADHLYATTAPPASNPTKRNDPVLSRLIRWATRLKNSRHESPKSDVRRCPASQPPYERPNAPPNTPNGCGASGGSRIPQFPYMDFTECCNGHDVCFGTCGSNFAQCNGALRSCQRRLCAGLDTSTREARRIQGLCYNVVDLYYGAVSGDRGRQAMKQAFDQRCACCNKHPPEDSCYCSGHPRVWEPAECGDHLVYNYDGCERGCCLERECWM